MKKLILVILICILFLISCKGNITTIDTKNNNDDVVTEPTPTDPIIPPIEPPPLPTYGKATLTWTSPTTNEDGSLLNDLSGFKIYLNGIYNGSIGYNEYTIENLELGKSYEFCVSAYNSLGFESDKICLNKLL